MTDLQDLTQTIEFRLPIAVENGMEIVVTDGEMVSVGDILARGTPKILRTIPVANYLEVKAVDVKKYLSVAVGDRVNRGDVLALKKNWRGIKQLKAAHQGEIVAIHEDGVLSITSDEDETTIVAEMAAQAVIDESGLSLVTQALRLKSDEGLGSAVSGKLEVPEYESLEEVLHFLDRGYRNKIVFVPGNITRMFWYKAAAMGVSALIGYGLDEDLRNLLAHNEEQISMSLLLFGAEVEGLEAIIKSCAGSGVYVIPERHELILPLLSIVPVKRKKNVTP